MHLFGIRKAVFRCRLRMEGWEGPPTSSLSSLSLHRWRNRRPREAAVSLSLGICVSLGCHFAYLSFSFLICLATETICFNFNFNFILKMEIVLIDQSSKCVILTPFSSLTEEYVWLGDPYGKSFKVTDLCEQQYLRFQGMDASLLHSELWPLVSGNHAAVLGIPGSQKLNRFLKKTGLYFIIRFGEEYILLTPWTFWDNEARKKYKLESTTGPNHTKILNTGISSTQKLLLLSSFSHVWLCATP